jgi:uncharacterized protein YutE (UPF0331/DUF86 family)
MSTGDVARNKAAIIERCVRRAREVYAGRDANLTADLTTQDSIILNIQRTCEASVDLAMHLVRLHRLGIPQESRHAFDLLMEADVIDRPLGEVLKRMVGFRNVAVHDYQSLNLAVVRAILERHLDDLLAFARVGVTVAGNQ